MACTSCSKPKKIIKAWAAALFGRNKAMAKPRLEICKVCPSNILGVCTHCGCPVRAKVRLKEETCPEGKW